MFHRSVRIKFIITLIYCIIYLNDRQVSAVTNSDICEYVNGQQIYCSCDSQDVDKARQVTCFIVNVEGLTKTSSIWDGFRLQRNITSFMFTTRLDKLSFLPVNSLRNIANSLETLNVNEMSLGVLESNSINNFTKLSKITLESNEIRGMSESAFAHLPALKSLSLSNNLIEVLNANVLINLPNLEELFLDRNNLTTIEDNAFIELKHLKELDLRLNRINTITSLTFSGLTHLTRLDLSRNQLKVIPNYALIGTPLLRELDLNKNEITTIEENAFHNMSHLRSLRLNENKIQYLLKSTFTGSPKLALIDLSNNQLETIEVELVDNLEHLRTQQFVIYLIDNLLECDCRLLWLNSISRTIGSLFKHELKHIKCTVKREFANLDIGQQIKILQLGKNEFFMNACQSKTTTERVIPPEDENQGQVLFPAFDNNINHSITISDNNHNNKIEEENLKYIAAKTHMSETTESVLHEILEDVNNIVNDAIEPNDSEVKSNKIDGESGGVFHLNSDAKIIISCLLMIFIFCKIPCI